MGYEGSAQESASLRGRPSPVCSRSDGNRLPSWSTTTIDSARTLGVDVNGQGPVPCDWP